MFPGQGSQFRGMGGDLFKIYREETLQASEILGYDLEELCLKDPQKLLGKTQYTQPALYVVNAFGYFKQEGNSVPDYLAGHSLGEYNALLAAGAYDFLTGLRLVQKRGELMAAASGGSMAAVLGIDAQTLEEKLAAAGYTDIDIANYNTPTQNVIAGQIESISRVIKDFEAQQIRIVPLFVSAPFHSRYMKPAADEFAEYLKAFSFSPLKIEVIANTTARPYPEGGIAALLSRQISSPVKWSESIRYLMGKEVTAYEEIGGNMLSKMVNEIREKSTPLFLEQEVFTPAEPAATQHLSCRLGSELFRKEYGIKYAYVAGAMYRGIASKELVIRMAKANMLAFLGTGGLSLAEIRQNIIAIQEALVKGEVYGMNLLYNIAAQSFEMDTVALYLKYGVQHIEAAAYMQMSVPLVYYRLKGLRLNENGTVVCDHKILAKVSRPEVAEQFMRPAPANIVSKLLEEGLITAQQALLAKNFPMSYDICVEADSGGHTDRGVALVLLPAIQQLKAAMEKEFAYDQPIRIGLAGGLGTPQAIACAFVMGADFVLTGSINQCTVESGANQVVKDLLQDINVQDTDYAPASDMFEIGAKVQVLKKGLLFPARANKLFALYSNYGSIEEIPAKTIEQLERNYFKKPLTEIWTDTKSYLAKKGKHAEIEKAELNPKHKMGLVFRWYFAHSRQVAFEGLLSEKVNFQVHTGPSLGSFNQWAIGTGLENWKDRHVDDIGIRMMEGAAGLLKDMILTIK